jgi:hypothetical protein
MPLKHSTGLVLISCLLLGCAPSLMERSIELQAERHMKLAETLLENGDLREATHEYVMVAEEYPATVYHSQAIWNAALMYLRQDNPIANDSVALYWIDQYRLLGNTSEEVVAEPLQKLLRRSMMLHRQLLARQVVVDSLTGATRKLQGEMTTRSKQVSDLDQELKKVSEELRKLKEVDVRMSKSRKKD